MRVNSLAKAVTWKRTGGDLNFVIEHLSYELFIILEVLERVCLSVYPLTLLENYMVDLHQMLLWSWLDLPLTALRYVK